MVLELRELGGSQGEMNLEWEVGADRVRPYNHFKDLGFDPKSSGKSVKGFKQGRWREPICGLQRPL